MWASIAIDSFSLNNTLKIVFCQFQRAKKNNGKIYESICVDLFYNDNWYPYYQKLSKGNFAFNNSCVEAQRAFFVNVNEAKQYESHNILIARKKTKKNCKTMKNETTKFVEQSRGDQFIHDFQKQKQINSNSFCHFAIKY